MEIVVDIKDYFCVKSILISNSDLLEMDYLIFLKGIFAILSSEPEFLYVKNYSKMVLKIISENRFENKKLKDLENYIIVKLNGIINNPQKKEIEYNYYLFQNSLRGNFYETNTELLNSINYDYTFVSELEKDPQIFNIKYLLSSVSYMLIFSPDYILKNEERKNSISSVINSIKSIKKSNAKKVLKKIKKQLNY